MFEDDVAPIDVPEVSKTFKKSRVIRSFFISTTCMAQRMRAHQEHGAVLGVHAIGLDGDLGQLQVQRDDRQIGAAEPLEEPGVALSRCSWATSISPARPAAQ